MWISITSSTTFNYFNIVRVSNLNYFNLEPKVYIFRSYNNACTKPSNNQLIFGYFLIIQHLNTEKAYHSIIIKFNGKRPTYKLQNVPFRANQQWIPSFIRTPAI